jgi:hypothetical protein
LGDPTTRRAAGPAVDRFVAVLHIGVREEGLARMITIRIAYSLSLVVVLVGCSGHHGSAASTEERIEEAEHGFGRQRFEVIDGLGGCDEARDIGILNDPQYGSFLLTGPNIPRRPSGTAVPPALVVGSGCRELLRARLLGLPEPSGFARGEVVSTCEHPVPIVYVAPTTFARPKSATPSQHWMWGCEDFPKNRTVAAGGACRDSLWSTTSFECVDPRAVVVNHDVPGDGRLVPARVDNPYAWICGELRPKEVCIEPGTGPMLITP